MALNSVWVFSWGVHYAQTELGWYTMHRRSHWLEAASAANRVHVMFDMFDDSALVVSPYGDTLLTQGIGCSATITR